MKTYEEAKEELYLRVKSLEETIKFLKQNVYYEKICLNCKLVMKVIIHRENHEQKKFCNDKCKGQYHYKKNITAKEKKIFLLRKEGVTLDEIGKQFNISKQAVSVILQKIKNKNEKQ
jgi:DNA-binding NarL/FixJ family response regulator|tara:strand:+ start:168 stop:518 length:351 start_codon:yes stop_codon:yes gene_type:complete